MKKPEWVSGNQFAARRRQATDPLQLRSRLVGELTESGRLPAAWRNSFETVPRHLFVPDRIWVGKSGDLEMIDRASAPGEWLAACYRNEPVITQLDDGAQGGEGYFSSSSSMPSIVAAMLDALDASPGTRVLEIGTGTGWNAALLADRVGADNVTSVEIDPAVASWAEKALDAAGWPVRTVTADGAHGYEPGAPYDRVLCTAAVRRVPHAWVEQTAPGDGIVTPWGTDFHNGSMARLTVGDDGTASGRFGGNLAFIWLRDQRAPRAMVEDVVLAEHDYTETFTDLHPYEPIGNFDARFAIGLRLPSTKEILVFDGDVPGNPKYTVFLVDPVSGAWAMWRVEPGTRRYPVWQHGPRQLSDELAAAYAWWVEVGRPAHSDFGLTVAPDRQHLWLTDSSNRF